MNKIKIFTLYLVAIFTIYQCNHASESQNAATSYLYNKNTSHTDPRATMRLVQESYITPEMQWEILSVLNQQQFTFNRFTGEVQGLLSVTELLGIINQKMQSLSNPAQKDVLKNGLRTMLEANEIATFVANVEACLQNPQFIFYQTVDSQLLTNLKNEKQMIEAAIKMLNNINIGEQSSYFSWLWGSSDSKKQPIQQMDSSVTVQIDPQSQLVTIPAELMPSIIKHNDYKQMKDPVRAANLLFKQCFIAQQHHLKDLNRINILQLNLQNPVSATNYIYTNFPDFYGVCQITKNLVPANQYRANLNAPLSQEHIQAHQLFMHARQAIQTAIYISNKKSEINLGYLLPQSVKSYLDSTLNELVKYENELDILCRDPRYGATPQDIYRDEQWANIFKYSAGIILTAAVGGGLYTYAPTALGFAAQKGTDLMSWWNSTPATLAQSPIQQPIQSSINNPQDQSWYQYVPSLETIGNTGKQIATTAGIATTIGSQLSQAGGEVGTIGKTLQQYGQYAGMGGTIAGGLTGNTADIATAIGTGSRFIPGTTGAVGGALGSSIGAYGALQKAYNSEGAFNKASATLQASGALASAASSINHAYQQINTTTSQQQDNVNIKILTPQEIYNIFVNIITQTVTQGGDLLNQLNQFIGYLFKNRMATPPLVSDMLQHLPQELAEHPSVAQPVGQVVQKLNSFAARQQPVQSAALGA